MGFISDVSSPWPNDAAIGLFDATPSPVALDRLVGSASAPGTASLAYDPTDQVFVLAWASDSDIWVGQMDATGTERLTDEAVATNAVGEQLHGPALAWGEDGGVVAYLRSSAAGETLEIVELNSGGNAVDLPIVVAPSGPGGITDRPVDVERTGFGYVVTFFDDATNGTSVARLRDDGSMFEGITPVSPEGAGVKNSALAWNGEEVGVVWLDDSEGGDLDVWFARYGCSP
jgi:hypothetical protein